MITHMRTPIMLFLFIIYSFIYSFFANKEKLPEHNTNISY